jgi:hypothetical protein
MFFQIYTKMTNPNNSVISNYLTDQPAKSIALGLSIAFIIIGILSDSTIFIIAGTIGATIMVGFMLLMQRGYYTRSFSSFGIGNDSRINY